MLVVWAIGSALATPKEALLPKKEVVGLIGLPDMALSTEAHYIRHRSLSDLCEVFGLGPALLPYFPSDYIYAPPSYLRSQGEIR